jgi:hypothetical protein
LAGEFLYWQDIGKVQLLMRDPHVSALYYDVGSGEGIHFGDPPRVTLTNHLGTFELVNGKLIIQPADHYSNGDEARAVMDPFLRAWVVNADLTHNIGAITFKFASVHKIDRSPWRSGPTDGSVSAAADDRAVVSESASANITQNSYPLPPEDFRTTAEVELAYARWRAYRKGREPLQSMAHAISTLFEAISGGRREAAKTFNVDIRVLSMLGRLSSTKGDATNESSWLDAVVRRLVRRIGEHAAGSELPEITMSDCPPLQGVGADPH